MKIDYLVTTLNKNEKDIVSIVKKLNIKGSVLVGNQRQQEYSEKALYFDNIDLKIFNLTSRGVSRNRNFLVEKSDADFIIFMDDDVSFIDSSQKLAEEFVEKYKNIDCIRFNIFTNDGSRTIRPINRDGFLNFNDVRSYGACGIFFNRNFIISNKLLFKEFSGPGSFLNHGEDTLFLYDALKVGRIYQINKCFFSNDYSESTWYGQKRNYPLEFFSDGYNYYYFYKQLAQLLFLYHLLKHKKEYSNSGMSLCTKMFWFKKGIKFYKTLKNKSPQEAFNLCYGK